MRKYKAAFINEKGPDRISYVWTEEQRQEVASLTEMLPGIFSSQDIYDGKLADVEVVFSTWHIPKFTPEMLEKMPKLQAVFYAAGATDSFARPCFARNVRVFSAWMANAIPVAEFCLAQILLGLKGYFSYTRTLNCKERFNKSLCGPGVYGANVVLIGAGAISTKLQELLAGYNVNVTVIPSRKEKRTISLEEAFKTAMVVSNHLPNRDDNVGVLNGELFSMLPKNAVFINTGRGRQVNHEELIEVLEKRPDITALLDVTYPEPLENDSKLYNMPNVFISPHIAGSINDEVHRMSDYMIEELKRFIAGEEAVYEVQESMLLTSENK